MREKCLQTSPRILREIKDKLAQLAEYEMAGSTIFMKHIDYIEIEADIHSAKIEETEKRFVLRKQRKKNKSPKDYETNLKQVSGWAGSLLLQKGFNVIDEDFIKEMAFNIDPKYFIDNKEFTFDPETNSYLAKYRATLDGVRVGNSAYSPPYPDKIPTEMGRFMPKLKWLLEHKTIEHIIEGALFAHLHLVRIHPFGDCNGRTSRALQNCILVCQGLPPPIIYTGERGDYYHHLEKAMLAWRARTGVNENSAEEECDFYNYMAGKISATLDSILDNIKYSK